jgi:biopolymer transport protein ExbB/TolQ
MRVLIDALYAISSALLLPVVVCLLVMLAWSLCMTGGFLRELLERRRVRRQIRASLEAANRGAAAETVWRELRLAKTGLPMRLCQLTQGANAPSALTGALSSLEHDIAASIARHSFITRVGPMLGLMGTLIPLGPALTGLANGNMQEMASNLVVAFTTTVVGVFISGLAYGMALARRTWYARDFTDLETICQKLAIDPKSP